METPLNVVPMPAEQREELKRLAVAATPGPWVAVPPFPALPDQYGRKWPAYGVEQSGEVYGRDASAIYYAGTLGKGTPADGHYIAAVSPDVALATLAYVEVLEGEVQRLTDSTVSNEVYTARTDAYVATIDELRARLTTLTNQLAEKEEEIQVLIRGRASLVLDVYQSELDAPAEEGAGWPSPFAVTMSQQYQDLQQEHFTMKQRAEKVEGQLLEARQELGEQEAEKLLLVQENAENERKWLLAHEALLVARHALEWCYDVCEYPANGTSLQAKALENAKQTLSAIAEPPAALPLVGEAAGPVGGPEYIQSSESLPEIGETVLIEPHFDWAAPELGRRQQDEHGDYWQVNGHRSTRYDIENWKGWFPLPSSPSKTCAAATPLEGREPAGEKGGQGE